MLVIILLISRTLYLFIPSICYLVQLKCGWVHHKRKDLNKYHLAFKGQSRQWHPTPVLLPGKSHGWRSWQAAVHVVAKSRARLSDFTFTFHFHASEKEMATHSSILAWRIPGTEEPSGLPSVGSHRVRHDWSNLAAAAVIGHLFPPMQIWFYSFLFLFLQLPKLPVCPHSQLITLFTREFKHIPSCLPWESSG